MVSSWGYKVQLIVTGNFMRPQKLNRKGILVKNVKSRLKNAFEKKVDFFQRWDGLPEITYGTENVLFKGSTSERSDVELVKTDSESSASGTFEFSRYLLFLATHRKRGTLS